MMDEHLQFIRLVVISCHTLQSYMSAGVLPFSAVHLPACASDSRPDTIRHGK